MLLRTILKIRIGGWLPASAFLGALVVRLLAVPPALGDMDEVHFADALVRYDLEAQSPHFPGYPVFVVLARLARLLGGGEVEALAIPGAILSALGAAALAWAVARRAGTSAAVAAASVVAFAPLAVVVGGAPLSDAAGAGLCALVLAAVLVAAESGSSRAALVAGALVGLLAGTRVSHLPLAAGAVLSLLVARRSAVRPLVTGAALATLAWAVPFVAIVGAGTLAKIVPVFLAGHATEWGKGAIAGANAGDATQWIRWIGLGLVLPALALLVPSRLPVRVREQAGVTARGATAALVSLAAFTGLPYLAWIVLGQNPDHARHAVVLVLPIALLAAASCAHASLPRVAIGAAALAATALFVAIPIGRTEPAATQLARHLATHERPDRLQLFGGSEVAVLLRYVPAFRAARPASALQLEEVSASLAGAGVRVLATSAVTHAGSPVATFEHPSPFAGEPLRLFVLSPEVPVMEHASIAEARR